MAKKKHHNEVAKPEAKTSPDTENSINIPQLSEVDIDRIAARMVEQLQKTGSSLLPLPTKEPEPQHAKPSVGLRFLSKVIGISSNDAVKEINANLAEVGIKAGVSAGVTLGLQLIRPNDLPDNLMAGAAVLNVLSLVSKPVAKLMVNTINGFAVKAKNALQLREDKDAGFITADAPAKAIEASALLTLPAPAASTDEVKQGKLLVMPHPEKADAATAKKTVTLKNPAA